MEMSSINWSVDRYSMKSVLPRYRNWINVLNSNGVVSEMTNFLWKGKERKGRIYSLLIMYNDGVLYTRWRPLQRRVASLGAV